MGLQGPLKGPPAARLRPSDTVGDQEQGYKSRDNGSDNGGKDRSQPAHPPKSLVQQVLTDQITRLPLGQTSRGRPLNSPVRQQLDLLRRDGIVAPSPPGLLFLCRFLFHYRLGISSKS